MLFLVATAAAADWLLLQGTEPGPDPVAVRPWGFVQALGEGIPFGEPVVGLTSESLAAFEGERASFNRVGSGDATWGISLRRARAGLRGAVPKTGGKVAWLLAAEFGDNGLTRVDPVVLTDASVTFSYLPGARIRVGQFKLPLGEEALEMNPLAAEFVNFSAATGQLLLENPSADGAYTAGASGFRDLGVQVFDTFAVGPGTVSYAVMLSNGRMGALELDDSKDITARLAWAPWVGGEPDAPHRDEVGVYGFWQQGERMVDGEAVARVRRGGGAQVEKAGWHARVEVIQGSGAIEGGANPPFPGQPVVVAAEGQALGGYAYLHYERGLLGGGLRYDELWRRYDSPADLRVFRTVTADVQVEITPRARLMLDYELRWLAAPEGSTDAQAIAATLGDRVSLQAAVVF
ncbi:MAG: hypothetical protein Q8P18_27845 [Pseudomonadota bacterium]|nr:hypothetical protein [Pseudomonadota bacterium]